MQMTDESFNTHNRELSHFRQTPLLGPKINRERFGLVNVQVSSQSPRNKFARSIAPKLSRSPRSKAKMDKQTYNTSKIKMIPFRNNDPNDIDESQTRFKNGGRLSPP